MKSLQLLSLFSFLLLSLNAYTQNTSSQKNFHKTTHPAIAKNEIAGMKKELNLSDAQVKELEAVEARLHTAFFAPARDSADLVARKEKIQKLQSDKEAAFQKILTPAQWTSYVAYMEEKRKKAMAAIEERRQKAKQAASGRGG